LFVLVANSLKTKSS